MAAKCQPKGLLEYWFPVFKKSSSYTWAFSSSFFIALATRSCTSSTDSDFAISGAYFLSFD